MAAVIHSLKGNRSSKSSARGSSPREFSKDTPHGSDPSSDEPGVLQSCLKQSPLVAPIINEPCDSKCGNLPSSAFTPNTAATRLKQVFFRCDGDLLHPESQQYHRLSNYTANSSGSSSPEVSQHQRDRAKSDSHQHDCSLQKFTALVKDSPYAALPPHIEKHTYSLESKSPRSKSPRFKLMDRFRNRSGSGSGASSENSSKSTNKPRSKGPPENPALLPSVLPIANQLLFTAVSLKNCKEPHGHRGSASNILCEHHGTANLQYNKNLVASLRNQLSHSLSTSADQLLLNLPPPTSTSSRLEQVLSVQKMEDLSRRSVIAKVAESDKFLMLCRKSHVHSYDGTPTPHANEDGGLSHFFSHSTCYDLMPDNSKMVVFDIRISIGKAFRALLSHGIRAGTLWDSKRRTFVGLLSLKDFVHVLLQYHGMPVSPVAPTWGALQASKDEEEVEELSAVSQQKETTQSSQTRNPEPLFSSEEQSKHLDLLLERETIESWLRRIYGDDYESHYHYWCSLSPEHSLQSALQALRMNDLHYLAVMNPRTGNPHYLVTRKRLLAYLHMRMHALPYHSTRWRVPIGESGAGTWGQDKLLCVTEDQSLLSVLQLMMKRNISSVPVVDSLETYALRDIFCTYDFIYVAASQEYKRRDLTLREVLHLKRLNLNTNARTSYCNVYTCVKNDSLLEVIERLVHFEVQRLVVVEGESQIVQGIVTIADILNVFEPLHLRSWSQPNEQKTHDHHESDSS